MKASFFRTTILAVVFLLRADAANANLIITEWFLSSHVYTSNGTDLEGNVVVQNPFNGTIHAQVGNSYVDTNHAFSWASDSGDFHVSSHQYMAQLDGDVSSGGAIYLTPGIDSILTMSARLDYNWPAAVIGLTGFGINVYDLGLESPRFFSQSRSGGNILLGPSHGTLQLQASVLLQAGRDYKFDYNATTRQFAPIVPGTFGTADATFGFNISPVPEPAVVALIGLAWLARKRPRR